MNYADLPYYCATKERAILRPPVPLLFSASIHLASLCFKFGSFRTFILLFQKEYVNRHILH